MKITFLGTSHGVAEKNRFLSSTLITVGDNNYIIDTGAPIMTLLQNYDVKFDSIKGMFITHTHFDHTVGFIDFFAELNIFDWFHKLNIPMLVPDERLFNNMFRFLVDCPEFEFPVKTLHYKEKPIFSENFEGPIKLSKYSEGVIFDDGIIKVTAIPNKHRDNSYSFYIEAEGKKFVFSGDLWHDMPDYPKVITDREDDLDFLVLEAAHTDFSKPETVELVRKSKVKKIFINHRGPVLNPKNVIDDFAEKLKDKIEVIDSYDGLSVEI